MKNLRNNIAKISIVICMLFAFSSCKKDNNEENGSHTGSFVYQGKAINFISGDYRSQDDGVGIYLKGPGLETYVTFSFPRTGPYIIPSGTRTYNNTPASNNNYNPDLHFSVGSVSVDQPLGDTVNEGTVTINKDGASYSITFDVTTAKGPLKGSFKGKLEKI